VPLGRSDFRLPTKLSRAWPAPTGGRSINDVGAGYAREINPRFTFTGDRKFILVKIPQSGIKKLFKSVSTLKLNYEWIIIN
jgi:hypothetical protein